VFNNACGIETKAVNMNKRKGIPPSLLDISQFRDQGLRLLIIENSDVDFECIHNHLRQQGMNCVLQQVHDLTELKYHLEHDEWHLVISEHILQGLSSEEAFRLVKKFDLDIPFIIVTSPSAEQQVAKAMRSGVDDYLLKNNLTRLVPAIESALRTSHEHRSLQTAERTQHELEKRLVSLTDNLAGVVFQIHQNKTQPTSPHLAWISEGCTRLFGLPQSAFLEDSNLFLELFEPADSQALIEQLQQPKPEKQVYWEGRLAKQHPDTPTRWFSLTATGSQHNQHHAWDGVLLEISEQKHAEEHLRHSQLEFRKINKSQEQSREQERQAIAQEIHDDMGASLTQLKTELAWLKNQLLDHKEYQATLDEMQHLVGDLMHSSQRIAQNLRPSVLDLGLVAAMQWLVNNFQQRTHMQADFYCNVHEIPLETEEKTALFRILQEALTNIVKHAQATQVEVELFVSEQNISLEIRDNGKGILPTDTLKPNSFGLQGMQDRVSAIHGWVEIDGAAGHGTTVMVVLPKPSTFGLEEKHD
jgi:two-component system sensor histidine kinase UhpB